MPSLQASVGAIAVRLDDIATSVAEEAIQLTATMRAVAAQTNDVAVLVAELEDAAQQIDAGIQEQVRFIDAAREELAGNESALAALGASAAVIASLSSRIRDIAAQSRILSLNARIEATRSKEGQAFAAVAAAMGDLATQTRGTTDDITNAAAEIDGNVAAASTIIQAGTGLADHQHGMIRQMATATAEQRRAAVDLRRLATETVERVEDAALGIGRVASAASIVGLLGRQMGKLARAATPDGDTPPSVTKAAA